MPLTAMMHLRRRTSERAGPGSRVPEASGTAIRLAQVSVTFGQVPVLREVDLDVDVARVAVIGANGSGKSTFARLLNGLVTPTSGSIRVHGLDPGTQRDAVRRRVGFVFSSPDAQILMPTVAEDVALSLRGSGLPRSEQERRVAQALDDFGLSELADAPAYTLSGGQKQLLALASVLVTRPSLVVADEPTTLLDLGNARRIGRILLEEIDARVVVVTHDLELASRCDLAVLFDAGRVVAVDEPRALIGHYRGMHA